MHAPSAEDAVFTRDEVEAVLDLVRPGIQRHGGGIDLVCIEGCNVRVALRGACVGCPSATMTLQLAVEQKLREELSGFGELIADAPRPAPAKPSWWRKILE